MRTVRSLEDLHGEKPEVVRVVLLKNKDYLTFAGEETDQTKVYERYAVVGTEYGHLRNTAGGIRFWISRSGAAHGLRRYLGVST